MRSVLVRSKAKPDDRPKKVPFDILQDVLSAWPRGVYDLEDSHGNTYATAIVRNGQASITVR